MTAKRILVVDDDPQIRTLLATVLEGEGFEVAQAANGQEMRTVLEDGRVALTLPPSFIQF